jgi:hypothetical protein
MGGCGAEPSCSAACSPASSSSSPHTPWLARALAESVAEYVLTCFRSWDPQVSLELVVQGPIAKMEEAARASIQDIAKLMAAWFQR